LRFLHVANGSSVTGTLKVAGVPGRMSIWAEPLHDGPVPGDLDDEALIDIRARHLAEPTPESFAENRAGLREWRNVIADHDSYDELVLWYEHDLFDQLNLIHLLSWVRQHVPSSKIVSLTALTRFRVTTTSRALASSRHASWHHCSTRGHA
jgi:hypothetical protein